MHIEFFYSYITLRHLKPNNIISAMQTILAIPPTPLAIAPRGIIFLFESHLYIAKDQMIIFSDYLFFLLVRRHRYSPALKFRFIPQVHC